MRYQHATAERDRTIAESLGALMRAVDDQPIKDGHDLRSIGE
jgi:hypothetical protein